MDKLRGLARVFNQLVLAPAEVRTQNFQKYESGIFPPETFSSAREV
jgi:hypothetical protein